MSHYMEGLKSKVGYTSMKIRHIERQAKNFPSLIGLPGELSSEAELGNCWDMEEVDIPPEDPLSFTQPSIHDKLIQEQKQKIEDLISEKESQNSVKEKMKQLEREKETLLQSNKRYEKKLENHLS